MKLISIACLFSLLIVVSCQSNEPQQSKGQDQFEQKNMSADQVNENGQNLFQANCASCHHPLKSGIGPPLAHVESRVPSKQWLYQFIHNSAKVIESGDQYANLLYKNWNHTMMTSFPYLSEKDIDDILEYCNSYGGNRIVE